VSELPDASVVIGGVTRNEESDLPAQAGDRTEASLLMTVEHRAPQHPSVQLVDGMVQIADLWCTDPDLTALVSEAADPESAVRHCLATGARALRVVHASVDTAVVERSFAALESQLKALLDDTTARVTGTTTDLLTHPEHGVIATMGAWRTDLAAALNDLFDPQQADSALARLDTILRDASEKQLTATRRLLNPDADDSPLSRLLTGVRDQIGTVLDAVGRLAEQIARDKATTVATAAALERSAIKGLAFEEQVAVAVTTLAAERGDEAEPVGAACGVEGGKVGDILVKVDPASIGGQSGCYVLECKDRRLSFKATMTELRKAVTNREALAAIAVFSGPDTCPIPSPFAVFNERAIVVYDKDDPDPTALRLACAWARWVVQREARPSDAVADLDLVARLIDEARRGLDRVTAIKRAHAAATKKIGEASGQVTDLADDLSDTLDRIERALAVEAPTARLTAAG
jgi:hypothetical protein